uniref:Uncharacterized protein n=1 Tax=Candidatus Kentrum sp. FW TaxID=2126338 RepID=A0A450TCP6_9GAMM|nr:MAG: hypothetical protein BECKFW1821B_GA0114236_10968 [Candidatus Kentron sp. FW]
MESFYFQTGCAYKNIATACFQIGEGYFDIDHACFGMGAVLVLWSAPQQLSDAGCTAYNDSLKILSRRACAVYSRHLIPKWPDDVGR